MFAGNATCIQMYLLIKDLSFFLLISLFFFPDGALYSPADAFLSRLSETGATESCSAFNSLNQNEEDTQKAVERSKKILHNIVAAIDDLWYKTDGLQATVLKALQEDGKLTGFDVLLLSIFCLFTF